MEAANGPDGLTRLAGGPPLDLVLTDLGMHTLFGSITRASRSDDDFTVAELLAAVFIIAVGLVAVGAGFATAIQRVETRQLLRREMGVDGAPVVLASGITSLAFTYLDQNNAVTATAASIRTVTITLTISRAGSAAGDHGTSGTPAQLPDLIRET